MNFPKTQINIQSTTIDNTTKLYEANYYKYFVFITERKQFFFSLFWVVDLLVAFKKLI